MGEGFDFASLFALVFLLMPGLAIAAAGAVLGAVQRRSRKNSRLTPRFRPWLCTFFYSSGRASAVSPGKGGMRPILNQSNEGSL
jgi:hypothetical protein